MGRNWAIVVGINHYENLRSLNFAKRDAAVMATWFQQEARFEQVFLFTDDSPPINETNPPIPTEPTFGHLRRFLRAQFENTLLNPEDNLWFFFAGHGNRYKDKDYLMFSDSDPGDIENTAISVDYVTQRLRRSGADNVVLFLDACRDESSRSGLGIGKKHQGVVTFYSCSPSQKSYEIEQLQHGSFTHSLLEGLRLHGEANCATVERLSQYLNYQVPALNTQYGKLAQNPDLKADPPYKLYFILLEQTATLRDVEPLKLQAYKTEAEGNLSLAKQLWVRVLAVSRGDGDAIEAIERIARKRGSFEPTISNSGPVTSSSGGRSVSNELLAQKQEEHRQNIVRYRQAFSEAIEREYPLIESTRSQLKQLQKSLGLKEKEVLQIEQPIVAPKEAEYRQQQETIRQRQEAEKQLQQEEERIRLQQEAERLRQQQEAEKLRKKEAARRKQQQQLENWRQLFTTITTPTPINRRRFLQWAGLGGAGLVTAVVGREIFKPTETVTVDEKGQVIKRDPLKQAKFFKEDLGKGITLEMVSIPGGSFKMGSLSGEKDRNSTESPQHDVNVPAFFMGRFEVTQEQYKQVMRKNPSKFNGEKRPVERVSWNDAVEFCKKLSDKTGRKYRLPSEAEWEYACRAGTTTPFHFGETMTTELANYNSDATYAFEPKGKNRQQTTEVGSFPPNGFGLYDMHGNVWEWCQDDWHSSYQGAPADGSAWFDDNNQLDQKQGTALLRGGSWLNYPEDCRSAYRGNVLRDSHDYNLGFRVVCAAGRIL